MGAAAPAEAEAAGGERATAPDSAGKQFGEVEGGGVRGGGRRGERGAAREKRRMKRYGGRHRGTREGARAGAVAARGHARHRGGRPTAGRQACVLACRVPYPSTYCVKKIVTKEWTGEKQRGQGPTTADHLCM